MNFDKKALGRNLIFSAILLCITSINTQMVFADVNNGHIHIGVCKSIVSYGIMAIISLLLLIGYCVFIKVKDIWMFLLYISVFIVNIGYLALVISKSLEEALLANRISYLGSVFLPLCMLMTIVSMCGIRYSNWIMVILICVSVVVFLIAASPGYLDCYYKEVTFSNIGEGAKLHKVYGPLHNIYPIYLGTYFFGMIGTVSFSYIKKTIKTYKCLLIILGVVFINIFIWGIEQFIDESFEYLSVSYIISEILLLGLYLIIQREQNIVTNNPDNIYEFAVNEEGYTVEEILSDPKWVGELTTREIEVFRAILYNKKRKDIAELLCVSENTVKKHTSHIFSKLNVKNRTELFEKIKIK